MKKLATEGFTDYGNKDPNAIVEFISAVLEQEVASSFDEASKIQEPKRPNALPMDKLGLKASGGVENIKAVYNQATPEEKEYWGRWYHNAKADVEELASQFGLPFPVMAAIVAVLSPGNKWNGNLLAAEKLLKGDAKINAYPRQAARALQILKTGDTKLVTGPKVTVFYKSLMDPASVEKDMVLDGHAINIWRGEKAALKGLRNPSTKERAQMVADYQKAAEELGVPVQAVQATTWYIWKYTGKTPPVEVPKGKYDVSQFTGQVPSNDNATPEPVSAAMEEDLEEIPEANGIGSGAVVGYGLPLGMGTDSGKKKLWSGSDHPKNEVRRPHGLKMIYNPTASELWEGINGFGVQQIELEVYAGGLSPDDDDYEEDYYPTWFSTDRSHAKYFGYVRKFHISGTALVMDANRYKPFKFGGYEADNALEELWEKVQHKVDMIVMKSWEGKGWTVYAPTHKPDLKVVQKNVLDAMGQRHVGGAKRKEPYGATYVGFSSGKHEDESGRGKQAGIVHKVNKNLNKKPYALRNPPAMGISITRQSFQDRPAHPKKK